MEYIHWFKENFIQLDKSLEHLVSLYGVWVYAILFVIIFCETGLVIAPFLPGDALLFAVGAYTAAHPGAGLSFPIIMGLLIVAAILGTLVNFTLGSLIGGKIFKENALILKKVYLDRTHLFFEKHGIMGVVLARFLPIFRTVAPFVAGMAKMDRKKFTLYTVIGSVLWVILMMSSGLFFGGMPWVQKHFEMVVIGIIFVSMIPVAVEALSHYLGSRKR